MTILVVAFMAILWYLLLEILFTPFYPFPFDRSERIELRRVLWIIFSVLAVVLFFGFAYVRGDTGITYMMHTFGEIF